MANGVKRVVCIPAGQVEYAQFTATGPRFINPKIKQTGNRLVGLKYEEKAHAYVAREFAAQQIQGLTHHASQWIIFRSKGDSNDRVRYCQPDHLIFDLVRRVVTIIEIKLQHCVEAHTQIRSLYEPVIRKLYPEWGVAALELVQWHDPHVVFPEPYYFEPNVLACQPERFAIHIWNPRYDGIPSKHNSKSKKSSASVGVPSSSFSQLPKPADAYNSEVKDAS